ncbi:MAG: oligosaccharide repeat unit polymerase [Gammaproteobacteria bacterium]|nr:oligosaccharide repeat unit polymerase [Solirubrobacterales bacterium]MCB1742166.1 oligosaccharide repeat unit polymerase [Gammaproteobacteria bacterium]
MTPERWVALAVGCLLLAIAVFTSLRSQRRGDGVLTTLGVFCLVWGIALVLFALPLVEYSTTSATVWLMVYGSIVTFIAGSLLAERHFRKLPRVEESGRQRPDPRRLRNTWIFFAVLGLVGFAAYVHAVDVVLGWRAIYEDPELVRGIQTTSLQFSDTYGPWKLLTYFNQIAFVLWTLGLRERVFQGRWRPAQSLGVLSLVPFLFTGDRTLMFAALVWAGAFQLLYIPPNRLRRLALGTAVAAASLVVIFSFLGNRVGKTVESHPEIASVLNTRSFDSVALPYVYATAHVPAFAGLVDDPIRPETNGELTFNSAIKVLHALGFWGEPAEMVGAFYPIPFETFNNYSWLGVFYTDFGWFGVLFLPFLFAFISTTIVIRAIRRRTLLSVWTGSLLLYCVALSFDVYKFFDTLVSEYLLVGLVIAPLIRSDLGPSEVIRRLRQTARLRPKLAGFLAGAAALVVGLSLWGVLTADAPERLPESRQDLIKKLRTVAALAERTQRKDGFPTPEALASQLHVNDPATKFVGRHDALDLPDPETISVFTDGDKLTLRAVSDSAGFITLTKSKAGEKITITAGGVARIGDELIANGGFNQRLRHWSYTPGEVGSGSLSKTDREGGSAFLFVGSGFAGSLALLDQALPVRTSANACFTFSAWVRSSNLSRPVYVWVSFIDSDGNSVLQMILGRWGAGVAPVSTSWRRLSTRAIVEDEVSSMRVFALDTGEVAISGSLEVDDLSLKRTSC